MTGGIGHNGAMAGDQGPALDDIAAELCLLPPDQFTAARNARAKEIEDPDLARQVKALRKPLLAAWVVNVFADERAGELGEALELADALREAQAELDASALTALSRDRRKLVRRLAEEAAELATARGERITASTADAVQETINAAMFDSGAAAAVASGRLLRPLETTGADSIDLTDAVAGTLVPRRRPAEQPPDEVTARRERKQAELALTAAEDEVARARRDEQAAVRRRRDLEDRSRTLDARVAELAAELERTRADVARVAQELDEIGRRIDSATERLADAERAADAARDRLGKSRS